MRTAILDKSVSIRWKLLGEIGEILAQDMLLINGFLAIKNLNQQISEFPGTKRNFPYADFYAERSGIKYVISVKIRNKYQFSKDGKPTINPQYKLGSKCYENAQTAIKICNADKAAWMTISLDNNVFSAYFGLLDSLDGSRSVKMTDKAVQNYECFAYEKEHSFDYERLKNTYKTK